MIPQVRHIELSTQGGQQFLPIPEEFAFPEAGVLLRKEGDRLIIEPVRSNSLLAVLMTLDEIEDDFPENLDEGLLPLDNIIL